MNSIYDMWVNSLIKWTNDNILRIKDLKDGELLRINGEGEPNIGDISVNNRLEYFRYNDLGVWEIMK